MCAGNIRNGFPVATSGNWSGLEAAPASVAVPPPPLFVTGPVISGVPGKCLNDKNDRTTSGAAAQIWQCSGDAAQQWAIGKGDTLRIHRLCLTIVGNGTAAGAKVDIATCKPAGSNGNQRWLASTSGSLTNPVADLCLDAPRTANGTQLQIRNCSPGTPGQDWWPGTPPLPEVGEITGYRGLCAGSANFSAKNGNPIVLGGCNANEDQQWTIAANSTLQVMGKCMDVVKHAKTDGSKLELQSCDGSASQQWQYTVTSIGSGFIVNPASGKCLEDPARGTRLEIGKCLVLSSFKQRWSPPDPALYDDKYVAVAGQWVEPKFVTGCPAASTYAIWDGIGGDGINTSNGPHPLLQNGTDVDAGKSSKSSYYAWWEAVGIPKSLQYPESPIDFPVKARDRMAASTEYLPASGGKAAQVIFAFDNNTTGASMEVGPISKVHGHPTSVFYDGSSAEMIAERSENSKTGKLYDLRKLASPRYVSFAGAPISTESVPDEAFHEDPYTEILNMVGNSGNLSEIESWKPDPKGYDADTWRAVWKGCS
jgi:hypothetical protein